MGAFHSRLMDLSAMAMAEALAECKFQDTAISVVSNVTAEPIRDSTQWPALLEKQWKSPVRWNESVLEVHKDGAKTYIECGAGEVLAGLIKRTIDEPEILSVIDKASLEATLAVVRP